MWEVHLYGHVHRIESGMWNLDIGADCRFKELEAEE